MNAHTTPTPTPRHDGWTPARKAQFLDDLAVHGNVQAACARVGMSREAAYRLRRRDPLVARAWAAALTLARESSAEVLGTRALDGILEDVWHRGEMVGTRRRYDSRLLLAHVARLDKLAEANEAASEDAGRFDELLALVAGAEVPDELAREDEALPARRDEYLENEILAAESEVPDPDFPDDDDYEDDASGEPDAYEAYEAERAVAASRARVEAAAQWDAWFAGACGTVDRLLEEPLTPPAANTAGTLSTVSTSALASALVCPGAAR